MTCDKCPQTLLCWGCMFPLVNAYFCSICNQGLTFRRESSGLYVWDFWRCPPKEEQPEWMQAQRRAGWSHESCIECVPTHWFTKLPHTSIGRVMNLDVCSTTEQTAWITRLLQKSGYKGTLEQFKNDL